MQHVPLSQLVSQPGQHVVSVCSAEATGSSRTWGSCRKEQLVRCTARCLETVSFLSPFVSVFLYFPHLGNGLPIWQPGSPLASPSPVLQFYIHQALHVHCVTDVQYFPDELDSEGTTNWFLPDGWIKYCSSLTGDQGMQVFLSRDPSPELTSNAFL